jgi:hypothetical protein
MSNSKDACNLSDAIDPVRPELVEGEILKLSLKFATAASKFAKESESIKYNDRPAALIPALYASQILEFAISLDVLLTHASKAAPAYVLLRSLIELTCKLRYIEMDKNPPLNSLKILFGSAEEERKHNKNWYDSQLIHNDQYTGRNIELESAFDSLKLDFTKLKVKPCSVTTQSIIEFIYADNAENRATLLAIYKDCTAYAHSRPSAIHRYMYRINAKMLENPTGIIDFDKKEIYEIGISLLGLATDSLQSLNTNDYLKKVSDFYNPSTSSGRTDAV